MNRIMAINTELIFKGDSDLIPAIIQDDKTLKVLMLGYMNREAYNKTIEAGRVTFYSRSRRRLWTKGESSNNYLNVKSIEADCDNDTLLIRADPSGPVCHTGTISCFNNEQTEGFFGKLTQVIQQRHEEMPEGSYTTTLFEKGAERISKKVGEEASEVIIEAIRGDKKRLVYEAGDLIYHLLVLLELYGLSISDIENELYSRHAK
jgi:phosphoribosyl-ATP pyrophosphohydrolase/phosphoribosyl-AMP cyclohydrolase